MFAVNIGKNAKREPSYTETEAKTHIHTTQHTYIAESHKQSQYNTIQMVCFDENEFSRLLNIVWYGSEIGLILLSEH